MATDQLVCPVTCPECQEVIPMPTTSRHGRAEITFDTSAVRAHIAAHGTRVQASTPGPGQQIISDADTYPAILADAQRHAELLDWLRANGIDPNDVSADRPVTIEPGPHGGHVIRYTALLRNSSGRTYTAADGNGPAIEERTTPLTAALPDSWPQPVFRVELTP